VRTKADFLLLMLDNRLEAIHLQWTVQSVNVNILHTVECNHHTFKSTICKCCD